jgi:hypothetical protein
MDGWIDSILVDSRERKRKREIPCIHQIKREKEKESFPPIYLSIYPSEREIPCVYAFMDGWKGGWKERLIHCMWMDRSILTVDG